MHAHKSTASSECAGKASQETPRATVFIVDDDPSVRRSLLRLLRATGYAAEAFASGQEFLNHRAATLPDARHHTSPLAPECLVLDLQMPVLNGLSLQEALANRSDFLPIIFISGHGDIFTSVQAMKRGAVDFISKPFDHADLQNAIEVAMAQSQEKRQLHDERRDAERRLATLTPREREVLARVTAGILNKQIAMELDIAEATVKVHRGRVMEKMGATSVAELVRAFDCVMRRALVYRGDFLPQRSQRYTEK